MRGVRGERTFTRGEQEMELLKLFRKLAECDQQAFMEQIREWVSYGKKEKP
jgi:hypothetical protein